MTSISIIDIVIFLSRHLLSLFKGPFPVGFLVKIFKVLLNFSHSRYIPTHVNLLYAIILTILDDWLIEYYHNPFEFVTFYFEFSHQKYH